MNSVVLNESKSVRFGVIGCGGIGPTHCAAIRQIPGAELIAVADAIAERGQNVASKFEVTKIYERDVALLEDPDVDAVCVCTPSGMHADSAVLALRAGKHVVIEKPMEVTTEACDRIISAQRETGKVVTVICQHRFDTASQLVKDAIDSGKLGKVVLINAIVPWFRTQAYYDSGDWRGTWAFDGGGAVMNQGIHTVDLMQWLISSQGRASQIFGQTTTAAHERIEVEDVAAATLNFTGGAIGTLSVTTAAFDGFPVRIEIYGTQGSAILEGDRLKLLRLATGEEFKTEEAAAHALSVAKGGTASVRNASEERLIEADAKPIGAVWGDAHRAQLEDFLSAIHTGKTPLIDGIAGRVPVEIITSLYRSSRSGFPVPIG